ncbi:MAG: DUF2179 domain-containing protein [Cytophagaceae bacterium]|jgi:uncharacterized protein YebE (UPF0316 family)|nr:DUF2179 domain-containing protein [Cytophagaceae bacterium]
MSTDFDFWLTWIIIPVLIFLARVSDVTLGTIRIVFVSKGMKALAPILGFFEIFIWLLAVSRIFENLDKWLYYVAYAAGFATGNFVGLLIEERIALGYINIRIITQYSGEALIKRLSEEGYGVTSVDATGSKGKVNIIYCVLKRSNYKHVATLIKECNPNAFYTIEDIRFANKGVFPVRPTVGHYGRIYWRKGK